MEVDCDGGLDAVEFRVIDTGIGIPEADLDRIFDDFVTIDSSYARRTTGTGLGLGISRRLARALGGDLGAESEAGEGSVFWLQLPMALPGESHAPQATAPVRPPKAERLPPLRVLVVEDNEINRLVAREFLHRGGHKVTEAPGGAEGVAEAAKTRFDVILMDISMPGMNGIEAARAIREGGGLSANVPIIATTAHATGRGTPRLRRGGHGRRSGQADLCRFGARGHWQRRCRADRFPSARPRPRTRRFWTARILRNCRRTCPRRGLPPCWRHSAPR
ncbi:ATP-binding protein [Ponticoccus litoralis]|uniref:ATP-binding protein n=1 Tax=Ponticoccus litoralis TaxID=422297 RepID=UPI003D2EA2D5